MKEILEYLREREANFNGCHDEFYDKWCSTENKPVERDGHMVVFAHKPKHPMRDYYSSCMKQFDLLRKEVQKTIAFIEAIEHKQLMALGEEMLQEIENTPPIELMPDNYLSKDLPTLSLDRPTARLLYTWYHQTDLDNGMTKEDMEASNLILRVIMAAAYPEDEALQENIKNH